MLEYEQYLLTDTSRIVRTDLFILGGGRCCSSSKGCFLNEPFIYLTNEQHEHNLSLSQIQPILILWNVPSIGDFDPLHAKDSIFFGFV